MTHEDWEVLTREFERLRDAGAEARAARLRQLEEERPAVVETLARMLAAQVPEGFLEVEPVPPDPPSGDFPRLSNYQVLSLIGAGGMGSVYRAVQRRPHRLVALKVLRPGFAHMDSLVARINHPGIVTIFEVGAENEREFYSMELVDGIDLAECIKRVLSASSKGPEEPTGCPLPPFRSKGAARVIAEIGAEIADALAAAHKANIHHYDVKPNNILLLPSRRIKIVDFGLAGRSSGAGRTPLLLGDPPYMSPERLRAELHDIDGRADVYSLGAVLYELLTLRRPFHGARAEVVRRILLGARPTPIRRLNSQTPADLAIIVEKAMEPDRADRYTAAALRDDLLRFLAHEAIEGRPQGLLRRARKRLYRNRAAAAVITGMLALAAVAAAGASHLAHRREMDALREKCLRALEAGPLASQPPGRIQETLRLVRSYDGGRLGSPPREFVALSDAAAELRADRVARARRSVENARGSSLSPREREVQRYALIGELSELRAMFPDDPEVVELASAASLYPSLSVRATGPDGGEIAASAWMAPVDAAALTIGPPVPLGRTPLKGVLVTPGPYRLIVRFESGGERELPVHIAADLSSTEVTASRLAEEGRIGDGMVAFPDADLTMPPTYDRFPFGKRTVHVPAFLIDAAEVSNK